MQEKKAGYFLIIFFILIIYAVPLYWVIRGPNPYERSWLEGRYLADFSLTNRGFFTAIKSATRGDTSQLREVIQKEFVERAFQKDLESAAADQFPFRYRLIDTAKGADRLIIKLAYAALPDPAIPADMQSEYLVMRDGSAILFPPGSFDESILDVIDRRIRNYATLIKTYPDIHFYVYYIERLQNTAHHPLATFVGEPENGQYYDYFVARKPAALQVEKFSIESYDDHLKYFYRTDHHWNIEGILRAYNQIHGMLEENYPKISGVRQYENVIAFEGVEFYGGLARKSFQNISEEFSVVDYALPPYQVYENDQAITYGDSANYLAGSIPQEAYFNHYEGYYGGDKALMTFVFEDTPDRNLLVIGNSYDNSLLPLLASHYHYTYNVDFRYYTDFSLSAFLAEHDVDDVVVIGENSVVFGSERYLIRR